MLHSADPLYMDLWGSVQCFCAKSRLRITFTNLQGLSLKWYSLDVPLKNISVCYYNQSQHILFDWFIKSSIIPLHYIYHRWVKFSLMQTRETFQWGAGPTGDPSLVLWQSTPWKVTAKGQDEYSASQPKRSGVCILAHGLVLIKWKALWSFAIHKGKLGAGAIRSIFSSFFYIFLFLFLPTPFLFWERQKLPYGKSSL